MPLAHIAAPAAICAVVRQRRWYRWRFAGTNGGAGDCDANRLARARELRAVQHRVESTRCGHCLDMVAHFHRAKARLFDATSPIATSSGGASPIEKLQPSSPGSAAPATSADERCASWMCEPSPPIVAPSGASDPRRMQPHLTDLNRPADVARKPDHPVPFGLIGRSCVVVVGGCCNTFVFTRPGLEQAADSVGHRSGQKTR